MKQLPKEYRSQVAEEISTSSGAVCPIENPSSLVELLQWRAKHTPNHIAYIFLQDGEKEGARLTYAELDVKVRAIAAKIQPISQAGDRVLLLFPASLEYLAAFLACMYANVVSIPAYPPRNKRHLPRFQSILDDAKPVAILAASQILKDLERVFANVPELEQFTWLVTDEIDNSVAEQWTPPLLRPETLAFLQYTSGSTSAPKGVMLTHGNLVHNQRLIQTVSDHRPEQVYVGWLPLFHDMGLGNALQSIFVGMASVLMAPVAFIQQPLRWLKAISHYKAHTSGGPNFGYELCVTKISEEQCQDLDLSSWLLAFNGAEPIKAETLARFTEKFAPYGFPSTAHMPCYGLAEATVGVSAGEKWQTHIVRYFDGQALTQDKVVEVEPTQEKARPLVGCGWAWLDQTLLIVNPETATVCDANQVGEIWLSSPSVGLGYWNRDDMSKETFEAKVQGYEQNFMRTGDFGFFLENQLYVTGRLKDMVIVRGRNHYPQDIEATIEQAYQDDSGVSPVQSGGCAAFSVDIDGQEELVVVAEVERRYQLVCQRLAKQVAQRSEESKYIENKRPNPKRSQDDWELDPEDLIAILRKAVTEWHDLHIHTILLLKFGGLPKTSSGKVQRSRCRMQFLEGELPTVWISELSLGMAKDDKASNEKELEPITVERVMAQAEEKRPAWLEKELQLQIARELYMPMEELDVSRPLNAFGLDSLSAVELGHRLETHLGVIISEVDLLEGMTIRGLVQRILEQLKMPEHRRSLPLTASEDIRDHYPLSYGQQALWFLNEFAPESRAYNISFAALIHSDVDLEVLRQSVQSLLNRHPSLSTVYGSVHGEPVQMPGQHKALFFTQEDVSDWQAKEICARLNRDAVKPFDLKKGPLLRLSLLSQSDNRHFLLLSVHHIAIDLWSLVILFNELQELYPALKQQREAVLSPLPLRYTDFVFWQQKLLESEEGQRLWDYWRQQLSGCHNVLDLPTDRARPSVQSYAGANQTFALTKDVSHGLRELVQAQGATLYMGLLACFNLLLHRYTGQEDILVGSPVANRTRAGLENIVGYFVDPVVLRSRFNDRMSFVDYLAQMKEVVLGALSHQDYPFSMLVERFHPVRDPSRSPLFQAMFVLQKPPQQQKSGDISNFILGKKGSRTRLGDMELESIELSQQVAMFDLMLTMAEGDEAIQASFQYNTDLFESSTIGIMISHFQTLVKALVDNPYQALSEITLMSEGDKYLLLVEWNDTKIHYPQVACLQDMFVAQVNHTPDVIALIDEQSRYNYWELNRYANQVAHILQQVGVGPNQLVGICIPRQAKMVVAILAILKAGGAYLPIDSEYPQDRIDYMIQDSQIKVLITLTEIAERLSSHSLNFICLDSETEAKNIATQSEENPSHTATLNDLAYMIYTSGSTGRPKGVMIPHQGIANHMAWMQTTFPLSIGDAVLQKTPFSFDASVWEFFAPLFSGACLIVARPGGHRDSQYMAEVIEKYHITTLQLVPSALRMLLEVVSKDSLQSLKRVYCGGEVLSPDLKEKFYRKVDDCVLVNLYGPTECTIDATYWQCERHSHTALIPIGRPIANTEIYILDKSMNPVPVGVPGELHIGGLGLAKGYFNRDDLSKERFVPNPFSEEANQRLYKTGDLARYLHTGSIEYLGRMDHQVKLRGYRIELGEIEVMLTKHRAVNACVVMAREDTPGNQKLVAYVIPEADTEPSHAELRQHLLATLPDYMVPNDYLILDAFPYTPSGKVDRLALPAPSGPLLDDAAYVAPRTSVELSLANIWTEVLGAGRVGIEDNFFEFGGHSLLATQVISRIEEQLNVSLPVRTIFETPTISGLAEQVELALGTSGAIEQLPLEKIPREEKMLVSYAQQRLWFVDKMLAGSPVYNMPVALHLRGLVNIDALQLSVHELVQRHESLRSHFIAVDGQPHTMINHWQDFELPFIDLSQTSASDAWQESLKLLTDDAKKPFDLSQGLGLFRGLLVKIDQDNYHLLLNLHHMVADGWSLGVISNELMILYKAFLESKTSPLPPLDLQYVDYAHWQKQWLEGEQLTAQIAYWKQTLQGAAVLDLPTDRPRPAVQRFKGSKCHRIIPLELLVNLEDLSQEHAVSLYMTLFSAFNVLLHRYSGQDDLVVGVPVANRKRVEIEGLIGLFVNTLAIRTLLTGELRFLQLLEKVREVSFAAYAHQDVPFEKLVEALDIPRDTSRNPLFQVMFTLQNTPMQEFRLPDIDVELLEIDNGTAKFDLWLSLMETAQGLEATLEYNSDLFDRATMDRMLDHYMVLLKQIGLTPEEAIARLTMLTQQEKHNLLTVWNQTASEYPADQCIHHLFEQQSEMTPDTIAVVYGEEHLSYQELNARANQLAQYLRVLDVGPDVLVGVCMSPSLELIIAIFGILKAGGAYVPMDSSYPKERLQWMAENLSIVLTQSTQAMNISSSKRIDLDIEWSEISRRSRRNLMSGVGSDNLIYVIYTSGSTGKPKATGVLHQGVSNLIHWYINEFQMTAKDKNLIISSIGFDLTQKNFFAPLCSGGQLVLPTVQHYDPILIANTMKQQQISLLNCAPSAFYPLLEHLLPTDLASLRYVFLGGEPIVLKKLSSWLEHPSCQATLVNTYGPTECTDIAAFHRVTDLSNDSIPIGRPNNNVELYVLDPHYQPVPIGVPGQLGIAGVGVGRGYIYDAKLTEEKFIDHPCRPQSGEKLYLTGDRVRYLANGQIEFLGRFDYQVKLRGLRIELGEIESLLRQQEGVEDTVVVVRDERLIAYFVMESDIDTQSLRDVLKQHLPNYMIPSVFISLEAFPLSPNGKVDRNALPTPDYSQLDQGKQKIAPRNDQEQQMLEIWQKILGVENIGVYDNFFELGGHSLLATQLLSRIKQFFKVEPSLQQVFDDPSIAGLVSIIETSKPVETTAPRIQARPRKARKRKELKAQLDQLSDSELEALLQQKLHKN